MFMMVTVPYLFLENMPFDKVVAYQDQCGNIVIEHGFNHGFVSAITYYSLFISVALGLPYLKPEMPRTLKIIFYALAFWVASALIIEIYDFSFPSLETPTGLKAYSRFAISFILLISFLTIKDSWIQREKL
jgi:hypothetical protein